MRVPSSSRTPPPDTDAGIDACLPQCPHGLASASKSCQSTALFVFSSTSIPLRKPTACTPYSTNAHDDSAGCFDAGYLCVPFQITRVVPGNNLRARTAATSRRPGGLTAPTARPARIASFRTRPRRLHTPSSTGAGRSRSGVALSGQKPPLARVRRWHSSAPQVGMRDAYIDAGGRTT